MDLSGQKLVVVVRGTLSNNTASINSTRDHDLAAIRNFQLLLGCRGMQVPNKFLPINKGFEWAKIGGCS